MPSDLSMFFEPSSIAIVGATDDPLKFGHEVTKNIVQSTKNAEKPPQIIPINPKKEKIMGFQAFPSLKDYGKPVDLVIVLVPKKAVRAVVEDALEIGTRGIIIVTAGFGEYNEEGKKEEQYLVNIAKKRNTRIIGPNCVGIVNTRIPLNASFIITPPKGNIAMISQSGSMGAALIYSGIPLGLFANIGNQADVTETEVLEYFLSLNDINVVGLYLETLKEPRKFYETIKNSSKPVVVLKSGRTSQGAKSAASHTGSIATSQVAFEAAIKQAHQFLSLNELEFLSMLRVLSKYYPIENPKIGIITNAGGPAVTLSDLLAEAEITLGELTKKTKEKIASQFPPLVKPNNPMDIIASAREEDYYKATKAFLEDPNIDILIPICVVPTFLEMKPEEHMRGVLRAIKDTNTKKPVLPVWLSGEIAKIGRELSEKEGIPSFGTLPEVVYAVKTLYRKKLFSNDEK